MKTERRGPAGLVLAGIISLLTSAAMVVISLLTSAATGQTTNPPGVAPLTGTQNTTNPPSSSATLLPPTQYAYPLLDTNGRVIWPTNFWTVNAAPGAGVLPSQGGIGTNLQLRGSGAPALVTRGGILDSNTATGLKVGLTNGTIIDFAGDLIFMDGAGNLKMQSAAADALSLYGGTWGLSGLNGAAYANGVDTNGTVSIGATNKVVITSPTVAFSGVLSGNGSGLSNVAGLNLVPGSSIQISQAGTNATISVTNVFVLLNVKAFGAVCDGVHDDTVAVSNALYAATQNGGMVFIPKPGTVCSNKMWFNGVIGPYGNPKIVGADVDTYIKFAGLSNGVGPFLTISNGSFDISDLTILGPGQGVGSFDGINYTNTAGTFILRNVMFQGWSGHPFITEIRANCTMDSVYASVNGKGISAGGYMDGLDVKGASWFGAMGFEAGWASSLGSSRVQALRLRWDTEFATNGIVIGGAGWGADVSSYSENWYNALYTIGHPPGTGTDTAAVGTVFAHDGYGQSPFAGQMVAAYTNASIVKLARLYYSCGDYGTNALFSSYCATEDTAPMVIENCRADVPRLMRFSDGKVITGGASDYDLINQPLRFFNKTAGGTNQLAALGDGVNAVTLSNNVPINSDGTNVVSGGFNATGLGYSVSGIVGLTKVVGVLGASSATLEYFGAGILTNVSVIPLQNEATNFWGRAGLTNDVEKIAVNQLVYELKGSNVWNIPDGVYPHVGSTSNSTAMNLVSSNYAVTWTSTGLTFDGNGVTSDGTGYGYPNLLMDGSGAPFNATNYTQNSASLGVYCGTATVGGSVFAIGAYDGGAGNWRASIVETISGPQLSGINDGNQTVTISAADNRGFQVASRTVASGAGCEFLGLRGTYVTGSTTSVAPAASKCGIFARYQPGGPGQVIGAINIRAAWIGGALTQAQATAVKVCFDHFAQILGQAHP